MWEQIKERWRWLWGTWAGRTWPVSIPMLAAAALWFALPTWELWLRWTGISFEVVALFIIGLRLWLIREHFEAPTVWAVVRRWWAERPLLFKPRRSTDVGGIGRSLTLPWVNMRGIALPGAPPPDTAPTEEQLRYLRDAVVRISKTLTSFHGDVHKCMREVAAEARRRADELDKKLEVETRSIREDMHESTAGNVQREQWAVFLLFVGAVFVVLSGEFQGSEPMHPEAEIRPPLIEQRPETSLEPVPSSSEE